MSRGNDRGREHRSNEPQLATVRRLHLDDGDGSTTTATEEWYETERLTGQITGRARHAPPAPAQNAAPVVLDWRHAEPPAPPALRRLGLRLGNRPRRRAREVTAGAQGDVQAVPGACAAQRALTSSTAERPVPPAPQDDRVVMDQGGAAQPGSPRLGLRGGAPAAEAPRRWWLRGPRLHVRDRGRLWTIASVVVVSVVVVLGITSHPGRTVGRPHQAKLAGAAPVLRAAPSVHPVARASGARVKPNRRGARRHAGGSRRRHRAAVKRHRTARSSSPPPAAGAATQTYTPARTEATSSSQQTSAAGPSHTSTAPRTSATTSSGSAGPTGSGPLGGIGSCVKGCT